MKEPEVTEIVDALEPIITALEASDYHLSAAQAEGTVTLSITAGADACEECLSPPSVLEPMVRILLADNGIDGDFKLRYPDGWTGGH